MAWAWDITLASLWACWARTECRIFKKLGFSLRESGVGGSRLVVPIERVGLGGVVGRRVRIWLFMVRGSGKTYWRGWFCLDGFNFKKCV